MRVVEWIEKQGVVLLSAKGPVASLAEVIAGEPIRGSWWGHPKGKAIFAAATIAAESPDVLVCKLVDRKTTFVHRRLWPALVALAKEIGKDRLARVDQEHTASGKHVSRVTPFPEWVPAEAREAAKHVDRAEARRVLAAVLAPPARIAGRRRASK